MSTKASGKIKVGDEIEVDSDRAGIPPREGRVLEVIEAEWGTRYHVLWQDGRESTIHPVGGTLHIREPKEKEFDTFEEVWR